MNGVGRLTTVVVRRQDHDEGRQPGNGQALVNAVVHFVNDAMDAGVYTRDELPAVAMQTYHADYYLAQVENGGHSQFIGNVGDMLPLTSADALAGPKAMGAHAQYDVLTAMTAWVKANPEEAAIQNGFSVRAKLLNKLDKRFQAAEREAPISEVSANWIAGWPELRIVETDQYLPEIDRLAQLNPHLGPRRIWQGVQSIRDQLTDSLQVTVAAACGAVEPEPEMKLAIHAGSMIEIEGETCKAFGVATDKATRLCVIEEAGGRLYEFIKNTRPTNPTREDLLNFRAMSAGARLSTVSAKTIDQFTAIAERTMSCEAIDLLLRKASLEPRPTITAWKINDDGASWILAAGQNRLIATTSTDRATITQHDGSPIAAVTRAEINRHAAEAAAGRASMQLPA